MKKFKFRFSKTAQACLLALLMVPLFSTCKKDDKPEPESPKSSAKELTELKITAASQTFDAVKKTGEETTFEFMTPYGFDDSALTGATVNFKLSDKAQAEPPSGSEMNLSTSKTIVVTAEDGSKETYTIERLEGTSSEKAILDFKLEVNGHEFVGTLNTANRTVTVSVPLTLEEGLSEAIPTFTCSPGAVANPISGTPRNFTEPVEYEITANDGTTNTWTVTAVSIPLSSEAEITWIFIDFYDGGQPPNEDGQWRRGDVMLSSEPYYKADSHGKVNIDSENGIVSYLLPAMPSWFTPEHMTVYLAFGLSDGWSNVDPPLNTVVDLRVDQTITVTAEDGVTQKVWTVKAPKYYMKENWFTDYADVKDNIDDKGNTTGTTPHLQGQNSNSIAYIDDYVVIGRTNVLLNKSDGKLSSTLLDVTGFRAWNGQAASTAEPLAITQDFPFFITNDDAGNMIGCNLNAWLPTNFVVTKWTSAAEAPVVVMDLEKENNTDINLGRKLQVLGDINTNALIVASNAAKISTGGHCMFTVNGGAANTTPTTAETGIATHTNAYQLLTPLGIEPTGSFYVGNGVGGSAPSLRFGAIPQSGQPIIEGPFSFALGDNKGNGWGNAHFLYQKLFNFGGTNMIAVYTSSGDTRNPAPGTPDQPVADEKGVDGFYCFAVSERQPEGTLQTASFAMIPWNSHVEANANGNGGGSFATEIVGNDVFFYVFAPNRAVVCYQLFKL